MPSSPRRIQSSQRVEKAESWGRSEHGLLERRFRAASACFKCGRALARDPSQVCSYIARGNVRKSGPLYLEQQRKLSTHVRAFLREKYHLDLTNIVIDQPPNVEMGEFALPLSFELAKKLRKAPRKIAEEIVAELPLPEGFEKLEVAGAGYINARLKRDVAATSLANGNLVGGSATPAKAQPTSAAKFWSSTPASIPTRRRTSDICATPFWAIRLCACCARPGTRSTCRTTSTTPACRWRTWWSASRSWRRSRSRRSPS